MLQLWTVQVLHWQMCRMMHLIIMPAADPVSNWWKNGYRGLLSLRYGIVQSANIVAVKTLTQITPQLGFDYLLNFGFTTLVDRRVEADGTVVSDIGQPLALGGITDGVTNMELNAAYAAIANKGVYIKPKLYTKIVDHDGNVLIDNTSPPRLLSSRKLPHGS